MSLDIRLPPFIIQDLFQKTLVDLKPVNYRGNNHQKITIIIKDPKNEYNEQQPFFAGILKACKLSMNDIALLNLSNTEHHDHKTISEILKPKIILLFGISPEDIQLPFTMPEFQKQSYSNRIYLSAPSFKELENNKELKQKLWGCLKQIFSI